MEFEATEHQLSQHFKMPPRIARASVASSSNNAGPAKKAKNKNKKRALNAYASAARQIPEARLNRNRIGEDLDDGPKRKRAREESDGDDDDDDEDLDSDGEPRRKKVAMKKRGIANMGDDLEFGSDSEGNEWTMGGLNGKEGEEESDLDSDEAFGESDEEKFSGFTFRGSKKNQKKNKRKIARKEVDLDESDGEIDEGDSQDDEGETFGEDGVDLATMLDDEPEDDDIAMKKGRNQDSESGEEDEGDSNDEESMSEDEDVDDDSADEEAVARNMDRIVGLDPSSRSSNNQPEGITTVDDFMDSSIAPLVAPVKSKKSKKKGEITQLAAKLPKRQQDKIDREVASAKAKEQLNRWQDTVKHNRREEFLTFPLQDPTDKSGITGKEKFLPAAQQAPQNELEASIQRIMEQSGLASKKLDEDNVGDEEQALLKSEELATNKLPLEEVLRRRAELRKTRELLFREEIKAKRIAKIKSKSYRRVHRKEKEREAEKERLAMEGLGGGEGLLMDEDEKERQDRKRAEARMGTKHKESKWAKSLKATGRAVWDEGARDGVVEQARREEELRKRIEGRDVDSDDSEGSLSPSEDEGDAPFMLRKLEGEKDGGKAKKGLAGMKFMREAEERKQRANDEDVERLRKEMAVENGEEEESEEGEESLGRALFGPRPTKKTQQPREQRLEFEAPDHSADEDDDGADEQDEVKIVTEKSSSSKPTKVKVGAAKALTASKPKEEGWLRDIDADDDDKKSKTNKGWLQAPKGTSRKAAVASDNLDILKPVSSDSAPAKPAKMPAPKKKADVKDTSTTTTNTSGWTTIPHPTNNATSPDSDAEQEEDGEHQDAMLSNSEQKLSLQQRAFAGDDVALAFEKEKFDQQASEDEQEISTHLPGWGNWAGDGLSKKVKKSNARAKHNPLFKTKLAGGVKPEDRIDKNMQNVIISQKGEEGVVRKGKKYLASQLPHEFSTREQYERSRRMPVGPEWVTKGVHQRMVRPRVVVRKGVNIEAINRPVV